MKKTKSIKNLLKSNRGAVLVEFAIIAPLLFVILFGIIEFGAVLYNQAVITNASREASRFSATYYTNPANADAIRPTCGQVKTYTANYVNARFLNFTNSNPFSEDNVVCPGGEVSTYGGGDAGYVNTIGIEYEYTFLVFNGLLRLLGGSSIGQNGGLMLTAQTTMRDENQQ